MLRLSFLLLILGLSFGQTTGKISGVVSDAETGEAIIGANVRISGTNLGAATDVDGFYYIINLDPGIYNIEVRYIGYKTAIRELRVSVNRTTEAKFYVNDSEIDGSSHTFNDVGTFDIYAKFQNLKSNTEQVEVNQVPVEYKQYVLVEDYTGTWCGYCTRVSFAIEELKKQTNDAIVIAIHQGDPMQFPLEATLRSHFGVTGFPTAFVDRKARWAPPEPSSLDQVLGKLTNKAHAALAMESSLDGDILTIKVKLKMGYNYKALRLGLYIVEDKLVYDQRNWTSYYQGDPIKNFEHNDVLRKIITGLLGDQIPSDSLVHEKELEK